LIECLKPCQNLKATVVQKQEKGCDSAPHCVSSMDPAAPEPKVDFTVNSDDVVDSENIPKGHRGLDESLG